MNQNYKNNIICDKDFDYSEINKYMTNIYTDYWNKTDGAFEVDDDSITISDAKIYIFPKYNDYRGLTYPQYKNNYHIYFS